MKARAATLLRHLGLARGPGLLDRLAGDTAAADALVELLFAEAPLGGLVIDAERRIVRANRALRDMAGHGSPLDRGAPAAALFAEEGRDALWGDISHALAGRPVQVRNVPARFAGMADREDAPPAMRVTLDLLRDGDKIVGGLLRFADMTLQTQLEAQLAHSQKLQAVGQLAGGIAHDFNNLLTTVLGAAESIALRTDIDAETREDAAYIQSGAQRGAALVRQLLAFGRQQTLQPRSLAVNIVIADISTLLKRLLGEKVRLVLDLEEPGRAVRADPTQLDQVLVNLAVNARDAMPEGGVLTLRSGHMTLYRALTRGPETIPPGRYVMIEVADTGVGIPPEILPRIFDPFFTTRRERGGHGLGLSTVHGIVRQSDGFLAVDSEPGQGTKFRVYLPRWDEQDPVAIPRVPEAVAAAGTLERGTILLVEDEEPVRRLAERSFARRGWRVITAETAEDALTLLDAETTPIVAVITDMVMPGMDGGKLVRAIRSRPGLAHVPAVVVSGYAEEVLRREMDPVETVFIPKPYLPKDLVARVEQILAVNHPPQPAI